MSSIFAWDAAKARANEIKHRVSFEIAAETFEDTSALEWLDEDVFHEDRWKRIGRTSEDILLVVYVERSI